MYLDATLGQSERCAARIERLATAEPSPSGSPRSPEIIAAALAASSDLIEQSRILVRNAREACDLLLQLRTECERLRPSGAVKRPVGVRSEADKAQTIRLVPK